MIVGPLGISAGRETVTDFTTPFYVEQMTALYKLNNKSDGKWKVFLQPFKWEVWVCIVSSITLITVFLWIMAGVITVRQVGKQEPIYKFNYSPWVVTGAILQQGNIILLFKSLFVFTFHHKTI